MAAQRGSLSCSRAGAGLGLLRASLMCRQGWGRARAAQCSQIEPSCTQSSWLCAGRALQGVLDKRHCIKDSTDLYSILTELLQSLSKWPSRASPQGGEHEELLQAQELICKNSQEGLTALLSLAPFWCYFNIDLHSQYKTLYI